MYLGIESNVNSTRSNLQATPVTVNIYVSINHTWMNFLQFHILEMVIKSNDRVYNCALFDDGLMRLETCRSACILKHYCNYEEVCVFCWCTL